MLGSKISKITLRVINNNSSRTRLQTALLILTPILVVVVGVYYRDVVQKDISVFPDTEIQAVPYIFCAKTDLLMYSVKVQYLDLSPEEPIMIEFRKNLFIFDGDNFTPLGTLKNTLDFIIRSQPVNLTLHPEVNLDASLSTPHTWVADTRYKFTDAAVSNNGAIAAYNVYFINNCNA